MGHNQSKFFIEILSSFRLLQVQTTHHILWMEKTLCSSERLQVISRNFIITIGRFSLFPVNKIALNLPFSLYNAKFYSINAPNHENCVIKIYIKVIVGHSRYKFSIPVFRRRSYVFMYQISTCYNKIDQQITRKFL